MDDDEYDMLTFEEFAELALGPNWRTDPIMRQVEDEMKESDNDHPCKPLDLD